MRRYLTAAAVAAIVALVAAASGTAARTQDTLICGDMTIPIIVTTTNNDNSVAWGVGTISGGDHFIPTSFSGSADDLTTGENIGSFFQAKGKGKGMHNQSQITCSTQAETATAGDLGIPGLDPGDVIQFTFTVTAVRKP